MDDGSCAEHRLAGTHRACAHLAASVLAREPIHVAARVEVELGELPLRGPPVPHYYCRDCAEALRLPAVSSVAAEAEGSVPAAETLVAVCAGCLDEAVAAAEARR